MRPLLIGLALLLAPLAARADQAPATTLSTHKKNAVRRPDPPEGDTEVEAKTQLEFAWVPSGHFHRGCEPQDTQCFEDEKPVHADHVQGFWMGKTVTTVAAYKLCVDAGACKAPTPGEGCNSGTAKADHPINCVDWHQARAFCTWLGGRLPTAEEWEYAAKGGESRIYPWGDELPNNARAKFQVPWNGTEPTGLRTAGASKAGLLDLVGNVGQWTDSDYDAKHKEVRGGPVFLRVSNRGHEEPSTRHSAIGFRCAQPKL